MLAKLNVRADKHNSCEDSVFVLQEPMSDVISGCISDGCSTGIKSHFASQLLCYLVEESWAEECTSNIAVKRYMRKMKEIKSILALDYMNLLATLVLFKYNRGEKTLKLRIFGDAVYYINGIKHVVDQNNTPDYIGYHLKDDEDQIKEYLQKYPEMVFDEVESFIICSDGIEKIERSNLQKPATIDPYELLLDKPPSSNYLERMWNTIKRDGFILSDDLTIISYAEDLQIQ